MIYLFPCAASILALEGGIADEGLVPFCQEFHGVVEFAAGHEFVGGDAEFTV